MYLRRGHIDKFTSTGRRYSRSVVRDLYNYKTGCKYPNNYVVVLIRSKKMQQYAGIYLLQNYATCFGSPSHPSSGVHKTLTAASGTGHSICATIFLQRGLIRPCWRKVVALIRDMTLYQKLQLHFYVLLMVGAMDTLNI